MRCRCARQHTGCACLAVAALAGLPMVAAADDVGYLRKAIR